ncbi:Uncharacterised protein [uncultured archaeon]|nr:Uncharacterised protein [uncultured archaeon]
MKVDDIFEDTEFDPEYEDASQDNEIPRLNDLRKTKLTLGQINRMRLIRDVRNFEIQQDLKNVRDQYGQPAPEQNMGM